MKRLVFVLLCLMHLTLFSQSDTEDRPKNSLMLNILGDGSIVSLNYDKLLAIGEKFMISAKLGVGFNVSYSFGYFGGSSSSDGFFTITNHALGVIGEGNHLLEVGLGGTAIAGNTNHNYVVYPILGYRLAPVYSSNVTLRAFVHVPLQQRDVLFSPVGFAIGYCF